MSDYILRIIVYIITAPLVLALTSIWSILCGMAWLTTFHGATMRRVARSDGNFDYLPQTEEAKNELMPIAKKIQEKTKNAILFNKSYFDDWIVED